MKKNTWFFVSIKLIKIIVLFLFISCSSENGNVPSNDSINKVTDPEDSYERNIQDSIYDNKVDDGNSDAEENMFEENSVLQQES